MEKDKSMISYGDNIAKVKGAKLLEIKPTNSLNLQKDNLLKMAKLGYLGLNKN